MKKLLLMLTISVAAVSLAACSQSTASSADIESSVDKYLTDDIQSNIGSEVNVTVTSLEKVAEIPGFSFLQVDISFDPTMGMPSDTFYIISDGKYIIPDVISFANPQETLLTTYITKHTATDDNSAGVGAPLMGNFDYATLTPIYGNADAAMKVVIASDFQCPYCGVLHDQLMPMLNSGNYDNLAVYALEFPLDSIHPKARLLSQIHVASSMEGNTLLTDQIFKYAEENAETISNFSDADILNYFAGMTSDPTAFIALATSQEVMNRVSANQNYGLSIGINSTPTVFINGQQIDLGSMSLEDAFAAMSAM